MNLQELHKEREAGSMEEVSDKAALHGNIIARDCVCVLILINLQTTDLCFFLFCFLILSTISAQLQSDLLR